MDKETKRKYNQTYYKKNQSKILKQKSQYQKSIPETMNERNRKYYQKNEEYRNSRQEKMRSYKFNWRLKNEYNLTREQYDLMLIKQDNKCLICKGVWGSKGPHIDHNHDSGKVRGILCQTCNSGIGMFRDNIITLKNAINYLLKNKS